jgi:hypothetical protein
VVKHNKLFVDVDVDETFSPENNSSFQNKKVFRRRTLRRVKEMNSGL